MDQPKPTKGYLCRRLSWRKPLTVRHGGEEIQILAVPVDWDEPLSLQHQDEVIQVHLYPEFNNNGSMRKAAFNMVFAGPRTFQIVTKKQA